MDNDKALVDQGSAAMPDGMPALQIPTDMDKLPMAKPEQVSLMQGVFDRFDADQGGTIDVKELGHALSEMGKDPSADELEKLVREADKGTRARAQSRLVCTS